MASQRAVMLRMLLKLILIYCVKKPTAAVNYVCYSFHGETVIDLTPSFIYESLHVLHDKKSFCLQPRASLQILLLLSGDVERCPGPDGQTFNTEMENLSRCKGMKLLHLNVRGLWSNFAHISEILSSHKFIDIFGFTETHITDEPGELFDLPC